MSVVVCKINFSEAVVQISDPIHDDTIITIRTVLFHAKSIGFSHNTPGRLLKESLKYEEKQLSN